MVRPDAGASFEARATAPRRLLPRPSKRWLRMSTSRRQHTADPRERKTRAGAATSSKPGKPRGRKKQEIRKECRTATWPETNTKGPTILTHSELSAWVGQRATRTKVQRRGKMSAQFHATLL